MCVRAWVWCVYVGVCVRVCVCVCVCVCVFVVWQQCTDDVVSSFFFSFFLAFDFCRFCVVIRFFSSPPQRPMTSDFEGFLYQILSITLLSYRNSWEKALISLFLMSSAKQGNYWYHFYNVFGMTWSLTGDWTRDLQHSTTRLSRRL